jgi:uncharacterized protein YjiS (DUF1127 family)
MKCSKWCVAVADAKVFFSRLLRGLRFLMSKLLRYRQLAGERRKLAALSDAALKDMGLSRADVYRESERPFWDEP